MGDGVNPDSVVTPVPSPKRLGAERTALGMSKTEEAQIELAKHLKQGDPDAAVKGGMGSRKLSAAVFIMLGLGAGGLAIAHEPFRTHPLLIAAVVVFFNLAIFIRPRAGERVAAVTPTSALRQHLLAIAERRAELVYMGLSPSARDRLVKPPAVPGAHDPSKRHALSDPKAVAEYISTFLGARPTLGRTLRVGPVSSEKSGEDTATCRAHVTHTWVPVPAYDLVLLVLSGAGIALQFYYGWFALVAAAVIALVLDFAVRKRTRLAFERTLLRGSNGLWYLQEPEPFGRADAR